MNIRAYHILSTIRGQQQHSLSSTVFWGRKQIKRKEKKKMKRTAWSVQLEEHRGEDTGQACTARSHGESKQASKTCGQLATDKSPEQ